uniref:Uncharacterized protein n=1 Tax=viral metagenome TaxID=1070528 RepID=A0A6C0IXL9_9ZZZZ
MTTLDFHLQNAILHRKSYVTDSSLYASEPYTASPIVLASESLWVDDDLMPNVVVPLSLNGMVDTSNNNLFLDTTGAVVASAVRHGQRVSSVQKRVRLELTRGSFGEYSSPTEDLRRVVHQNYGQGYSSVVEYESNGTLSILQSHLWEIQHMAGVVTIDKAVRSLIPQIIFITAYLYCGRVGIDKSIKDTTTDDIEEGVTNKFFTRELLLSHITELATDNTTNFVISVANSDSITEGIYNRFFTQNNFDSAFNSKYVGDLNESDDVRLVTSQTMSNLNLSVGGVSEMGFNVNFVPPNNTNAKLYVERGQAGENVLYFENKPIGATDVSSMPSAAPQSQADSLGNFSGYFEGPTRGVHTGDVKGNVQGFVSDLGNHPIIEAKLLGDGEGHWVGTVNGDVVGKFEGHAKVITGSIDNASHVTVGTFDSTASLHVKSSDSHFQISNTDGGSALIECLSESRLAVSCSVLETNGIVCGTMDCSETLTVNDLNANNIKCTGLTNSFYGIFETGRIEDVSEIFGLSASLSICNTESSNTLQLSCADLLFDRSKGTECIFDNISCNTCIFDEVKSNNISVSSFHVENLFFDASVFLDNPNIVFNTLSVSEITSNSLSLGNVRVNNITTEGGASMPNIFSQNIHADSITTQTLSISSLYFPEDFSMNILTLSVQSLSIESGNSNTLSVANIFYDSCESSNTKTTALESSTISTNSFFSSLLSVSSVNCDFIHSTDAVAHSVSVSSCNSVTMFSESLSSSSIFTNDLSCSNAIVAQASISSLDSTFIETQSLDSHSLSAQTLFSDSILTVALEGRTLSVNFAHIDHGSVLSIALSFAQVQQLKSDIHLSSYLSVNSSFINSLSTDTLSVNSVNTNRLRSYILSTGSLLADLSLVQNISCSNSIKAVNMNTNIISVGNIISESIVSQNLSVNNTYSPIAVLGLLSVSNANIQNTFASILSCSALKCDDINAPRANFDILSVNSIVGVDLTLSSGGVSKHFVESLFLSVNESIETALNALSLQDIDGLNSLSCSAGKINVLSSDTILVETLRGQNISASEIAVSSLSVAILHGIVLTQDLSVTGLVGHISASSVTASDLSCGTLFIDQIVRSIPHVSDTADPAVLTTSTVGDFALFAEDTKHSGDMIIEGSLYVTDTIFMGTQPSLNIENVQNMIASSISVGELAVGMLTGIGGGTLGGTITDIVSSLLSVSPHDTVHEGNMQIEGNLLVSGVVLTGAHNKLMHNHGSFEMEGTLSVSGDIFSNGINIIDTLLSLQQRLDSLA